MTNSNPRNLGAPQGPGFLVIKSSNGKYLSPSSLLLIQGLTFIRVLFLLHSTACFLFLLKLLLFVFLFVCVLTTFLFLLPSSVTINIIIPFPSTFAMSLLSDNCSILQPHKTALCIVLSMSVLYE